MRLRLICKNKMKGFDAQDMQRCIRALSLATNPFEALASWSCLRDANPNLFAIVALQDWKKTWLPVTLEKYMAEPNNFLIPYFSRSTLYFMDDHIFTQMSAGKEVQFRIDYTLTLDTNMVTYVDALVQGRSLENVPQAEYLLKSILHDDLNFDSIFYMVENLKTVRKRLTVHHGSAFQFWKSLNSDFQKNMVSFQLFRSVDCAAYKATGVIKTRVSYREAVRAAVQYSYDFYACELGSKLIRAWELR